jgi:hypothetical protein
MPARRAARFNPVAALRATRASVEALVIDKMKKLSEN